MGLFIGLIKFGFFAAIAAAVIGLVLAPFTFLWERYDSKRLAESREKSKAECERINWEMRVHNAILDMMSATPGHSSPSLILESMREPGHNWRVFKAVGIRYQIEELGRAGLVQGDGTELAGWIAAHRVECAAAMNRYRAKEQAIKDAIDSNAARWEETEDPIGLVHKSPARMGLESLKRD